MSRNKNSGRKGGKFFPALCNFLGIAILLATIAVSIPLAIPRFLGFEPYNIVSGSMEPTIPVGSLVYIKETAPEDIQAETVIAFQSGNSIVVHRVKENHYVEGTFVTKGDANPRDDLSEVPYRDVIGVVAHHFPYLGQFLSVFSSRVGKIYVLLFALCGIMFNILASRLRNR